MELVFSGGHGYVIDAVQIPSLFMKKQEISRKSQEFLHFLGNSAESYILLKTQLKNTKETIGFHCVFRKEPLKSRKVPFRSENCKKVARDHGFYSFDGNSCFCTLWGTSAQTIGKAASNCAPLVPKRALGFKTRFYHLGPLFSLAGTVLVPETFLLLQKAKSCPPEPLRNVGIPCHFCIEPPKCGI